MGPLEKLLFIFWKCHRDSTHQKLGHCVKTAICSLLADKHTYRHKSENCQVSGVSPPQHIFKEWSKKGAKQWRLYVDCVPCGVTVSGGQWTDHTKVVTVQLYLSVSRCWCYVNLHNVQFMYTVHNIFMSVQCTYIHCTSLYLGSDPVEMTLPPWSTWSGQLGFFRNTTSQNVAQYHRPIMILLFFFHWGGELSKYVLHLGGRLFAVCCVYVNLV